MDFRRSAALHAYRIAPLRPGRQVFDSQGAYRVGGRWNSPGRHVIYAAESYACSVLEVLVHLGSVRLPTDRHWVRIDVPASVSVEDVALDQLPTNWDAREPSEQTVSRAFGDAWLSSRRSAVLLVPSRITQVDRNLLINPEHPEFSDIRVSREAQVVWDERLIAPWATFLP